MTSKRLGSGLMIVGGIAEALGLGIDAYEHIKDPTLAAREALLTFSNIGHVLLLGGIALVVVGVMVALLVPRLARTPVPIRFGVPLVLAVLMGMSSVAAANSGLAHPHDHGAAGHSHGGGVVFPQEPVSANDRALLAKQLTDAREVAERYSTVAKAEAAGYTAVTKYIPLIGAHYMRFVSVDSTFDLEQPEMLLYDGNDPTSKIVGLSYYVRSKWEPKGFAGPNDHWHQHLGLCLEKNRPFVIGSENTSLAECIERGGVKSSGTDGWMVHAWVVPSWESPQGVFSAENAQLK